MSHPTVSSPVPVHLTGRVVIVDDEVMVTQSIHTMLALDTDYHIHTFNSPQAALTALTAEPPPDVVISDFLMPDMNGIEFLQAIHQRFPQTTLILLTGYADKENAIQAINEVGIYRYLEKPWDNEALKLAIRNGIERTRLMSQLSQKIEALEQAQHDLKIYSEHLEERVTEKTQDLTSALNKLRTVVENTTDGILTLDNKGVIQRVNPTFARWAKLAPSKLEGQSVRDFLTFDDPLAFADTMEQPQESLLWEARLGAMALEVNISPLPVNEGVVLICRDIGRRKEAERLREDFVSTLTHDLRTPLLAGIQTLGLILDGTLGEPSQKQRDILAMLVESNQDMLELVNVLLEVYRYEAKQQKLILEPFQLADLTHQVLLSLDALAKNKQQQLRTSIVEPLPLLIGDKHALKRVITNLVGNAIHYTPTQGRILVSAEQTPHSIILKVQDNGRGIPPKDLKTLFQRFAQGTSKHRTTGSGLGLYLSRQIIEAHGGRIWAHSTEGEGSTFYIELPLQ